MSEVTIEKGVPLPEITGGRTKFPWRRMAVGDSFRVPARALPNVSALASATAKRLGTKYACRKDGDGVRVWRVA